MFWIKSNKLKTQNDYLYLRETIYVRDGRTLKRLPRKLGDGSATKNRGKYSKKKDIYCGKIIETKIDKIITFENYLHNIDSKLDFLEYKLNNSFDKILYDFVDYLLYIRNIEKDEFYGNKKKVFFTGSGYLCKETINRVLNFNIKGSYKNEKNELHRFALKCIDAGVYDEEIISVLFMKLNSNNLNKYYEIEEKVEIKKEKYSSVKDFMKTQYDK